MTSKVLSEEIPSTTMCSMFGYSCEMTLSIHLRRRWPQFMEVVTIEIVGWLCMAILTALPPESLR
jgi:hypothetical protein